MTGFTAKISILGKFVKFIIVLSFACYFNFSVYFLPFFISFKFFNCFYFSVFWPSMGFVAWFPGSLGGFIIVYGVWYSFPLLSRF